MLIFCAVFVVVLAFSTAMLLSQNGNLQNQVNTLEADKNTLQNQVSSLETQLSSLETEIEQQQELLDNKDTQITDLQNQIDTLITQVEELNNQIESLNAPYLANVGVGAADNREYDTYYLHVYGSVTNFGRNTAYNSNLHVIAYYINGTVAIDTYVYLSEIPGMQSASIYRNITYESPLLDMTRVTLSPEFTETP